MTILSLSDPHSLQTVAVISLDKRLVFLSRHPQLSSSTGVPKLDFEGCVYPRCIVDFLESLLSSVNVVQHQSQPKVGQFTVYRTQLQRDDGGPAIARLEASVGPCISKGAMVALSFGRLIRLDTRMKQPPDWVYSGLG